MTWQKLEFKFKSIRENRGKQDARKQSTQCLLIELEQILYGDVSGLYELSYYINADAEQRREDRKKRVASLPSTETQILYERMRWAIYR